MQESLLTLKNISKSFPGVKALNTINIDIKKNEIHALVGENGAGKSTLIKILTGIYQPDKGGEIYFQNNKICIEDNNKAKSLGISVIFQDLSLFDNLSVAENISLSYREHLRGLKKFFISWSSMKSTAKKVLDRMGIKISLDTMVGELSISQKQMIAIAKSLIGDPQLIIMDEPTSSLSTKETEVLLKILQDLKAQGISIIYISHKLEELYQIGDRFTVIRDGVVIGTWAPNTISENELIHSMVGREVTMKHIPRSYVSEKIVLEAQKLSKKGNFKNISFSIREGEIVGFSGIVGAGRTELMEAIFGITQFDTGILKVDGLEVKFKTPHHACQNKVAFVPEDRKNQGLVLSKSIYENINMVISEYKNKKGFLDSPWMKFNTENWIAQLEIRPNIPEMMTMLQSGGNQQKVVLAKCLSTSPKLLIIDEPTNGIDVGAKANIHNLIRSLADEGLAVIVVSSDLLEIMSISDRIIVMKRGQIIVDLKNKNLTQNDIMKYAI
ncbi:MAG: sugar ABC transporter ATP-binding protein [Brevinema sp.]